MTLNKIKNNKILLVVFTFLLFCQTAYASNKIADSTITVKLKSKLLLEKDIKSTDVHITTENGTVHLEGQVDTTLQSNRIVELAFSVDGVEAVDTSKFYVNQQPASFLDDLVTTAKVYGKIQSLAEKNSISNNYSVRIETFDHKVHIWGFVGNKADIKVINNFISKFPEVEKVYIKLQVRK